MASPDTDPAPVPDELVIRPSQVINYGAYFWAAVQMVVCAVLFAILRRYWPMQWPTLSPFIVAIPLVAILGLASLTWLKTASTSYHFAKGRLTWRMGILSRTAESLELYRIGDVTMHQPLFQRLFGVGRIVISSADANHREVVMEGVPGPDRFRDWLTDAVQQTRRERGMREMQLDQLGGSQDALQ
jgi:membrane protein YdbS with pleckstrin-like domain